MEAGLLPAQAERRRTRVAARDWKRTSWDVRLCARPVSSAVRVGRSPSVHSNGVGGGRRKGLAGKPLHFDGFSLSPLSSRHTWKLSRKAFASGGVHHLSHRDPSLGPTLRQTRPSPGVYSLTHGSTHWLPPGHTKCPGSQW